MAREDDRLRAERARFGENLRAAREARGMGQRELARLMAERGRSWHQNTVSKTEGGERTPNAFEVGELAAILGVTTDRFYWLPPEASGVAALWDAAARLSDAYAGAVSAVAELEAARAQARSALSGHRDSRFQRVRDACEALDYSLEGATPEAALADGKALLEREGKA